MSTEWEWIDGYDNTRYTDAMIFEVDQATKMIQQINDQTMVSGENKSQFIRFEMDRYYDGIDLSTKSIQIIYITEGQYSDINAAVCAERNDDSIRFGWVVPAAACYEPGTLAFSIEFVGDDYVLKTRTYEIEVYDGLNGGEVIPEPEEKVWYIELQQRCDYVLAQAESAETAAAGSASAAAMSQADAAGSKAAAKASEDNAKKSETAAAASESSAQQYAQQAAAVFQLAGSVSFTVGDDNGLTMIITKED